LPNEKLRVAAEPKRVSGNPLLAGYEHVIAALYRSVGQRVFLALEALSGEEPFRALITNTGDRVRRPGLRTGQVFDGSVSHRDQLRIRKALFEFFDQSIKACHQWLLWKGIRVWLAKLQTYQVKSEVVIPINRQPSFLLNGSKVKDFTRFSGGWVAYFQPWMSPELYLGILPEFSP
jgi:hypothetical protein